MPTGDPLAAVPDNSNASRIGVVEAALAMNRQFANVALTVGDWVYTSAVPTNWNTPGTIILVGNRMVPNGVNLGRADFPVLNALYKAAGYPFGSGDGSTTFGTPDCLARMVVCIGTHTDVSGLNKNDAVALANRTPKHGTSIGTLNASTPSLTGTTTFVTSLSEGNANLNATGGVSWLSTVTANTASVGITGGGLSGVPGASGTRPIDMAAYIVAGIWMLIVG